MDAAYCVGGGRLPPSLDPLVWSLRTVYHHLDVDRVFIVGAHPKPPPGAVYLQVPQTDDQWSHMGANLLATLSSDISEDFYWFNDDFFILHNQPDPIPLYHRGLFDDYLEAKTLDVGSDHRRDFLSGMFSQRDILREWGYTNPPCTDLHVPMHLNKTRLKHIIDRVQADFPDHPLGHFRALYGAGLESVFMRDCKVSKTDVLPPPEWEFVSTAPNAWRQGDVGRWIRGRYWRPSPWEAS